MTDPLAEIRESLNHMSLEWKPSIWLDTGIPDLNLVIGHKKRGIPYGRIIEMSGLECVTGETLVDCPRNMETHPDGIPIKDLVGQQPYVYSYDRKQQRMTVRRASRVWKTGRKPVYKVTFDVAYNHKKKFCKQPEYIIATDNHPFLLRKKQKGQSRARDFEDAGYCALADLKPGDRLMPFYRKRNTQGMDGKYRTVYLNNGECIQEHRFILNELQGVREYPEWDAHHKDENALNNEPENLEWKTHSAHRSDHLSKLNLEGKAGWQKTGVHPRGMTGKLQTTKQRNAARQLCHKRNRAAEDAWIAQQHITSAKLRKLYWGESLNLGQLAQRTHTGVVRIKSALRRFGIELRKRGGNYGRQLNHRVAKVEFYGYEDVYDMTVPGTENFVANGVIVHNSHGKTAITMALAALAQRDKAMVIWTDLENSFDTDWALQRGLTPCPACNGTGRDKDGKCCRKCGKGHPCQSCDGGGCNDCKSSGEEKGTGLDSSCLTLIQPYVGRFIEKSKKLDVKPKFGLPRLSTGTELLAEAEKCMIAAQSKFDRMIAVVDSTAAILTDGEAAAGLEGGNMRVNVELSMFLSRLLRRWVGLAQAYNAMIIMTNQLRMKPGVKFGSPWYTVGGNAPHFYSHIRVRVQRVAGSKILEKGKVIGIKGVMTAEKNKSGGLEGSAVGYKIMYAGPVMFVPVKEVKAKEKDDE